MIFAQLPLAFLFETPLAALAVAAGAASIPLVIHLLSRNRFRVVTWAAMRFLLAAQRKNTRRLRLEQIVLLTVRTLAVLLLVLAMASVMPWAEGAWQRFFPESVTRVAAGSRRTHKILVLDGSFSMALRTEEHTCFDRAKEAAERVVTGAKGSDGFSVVLMAVPPRRVVSEPSEDSRKVAEEIRGLALPHGNADLTATLLAVDDLLGRSPAKFEEKEVYFFTDLQRSTWTARQTVDPVAALQKIRGKARTIFVDVGRKEANNLAVTNLVLGAPLATTGSVTPFLATVRNYGVEARKGVRVELWVGKARELADEASLALRLVQTGFLNLSPGQTDTVTLSCQFRTAGDYAVQVRLERDDLELDDTRSVILTVKDTLPVMLVNGKPAVEPLDRAAEWVRVALNPFDKGVTPRNIPARPKVISESQFADAALGDLTPFDCVFLCDVARLGIAEVRRLETHLQRGGGVVFCLGPKVDSEAYNRLLYRNGEGLLPARLLGSQRATENRAFTLFAEEDLYKSPPLNAFAGDNDKASLLAARFRQYFRAEVKPRGRVRKILTFYPEAKSSSKAAAAEALPLNDPALVEETRYRGKVLLWTSTVNMDWTTWPISPSYPAMMQELLRFAVAGRLREQSGLTDEPWEEYLSLDQIGQEVSLQTPEGKTEATRVQDREDKGLLRWTNTDGSGLYRATVGQAPREHLFAVNVPTATEAQQASESDLARTSGEELRETYPGWDFQLVTDTDAVVHAGGLVASGSVPLHGIGEVVARWLLLAMLSLILVEVVLAWQFGHYRVGLEPREAPSGRRGPDLVFKSFSLLLTLGVVLPLVFVLLHSAWTGDFLGFLPDRFRQECEAGLGIPPPAPGEGTRWRLEFTPYLWNAVNDIWLVPLLGLAAAAFVVVIYRKEGHTASPNYKLLLAGLRLGLVLLTLTVLLPQLRFWFERQGWPDLAIIVDDSRSMSTADSYRDPALLEAARRLVVADGTVPAKRLQLVKALLTKESFDWLGSLVRDKKVKVHVYHCSSGLSRIGDITDAGTGDEHASAIQAVGALDAEGESSQLGNAVRQVINDFRGSSLTAILMLTDGVTTEGEDLAKAAHYASQMGVPLFFVGVGDSEEVKDLKIHDLQVEDTVFVNDRLIFEAKVSAQGYTHLTVPVTLKEKGKDKVLATQIVKLDSPGATVKVRLAHQPTEPGEKVYVLEVPVQTDEVRPADNNRLERTVFVRQTKLIKVLYVEGYARYEYRFVKNLLERESDQAPQNKTIDLKVLLLDADDDFASLDKSARVEFPGKAELQQYDVVLWGDVDPKHPKIGDKHLQDVADFIRERGGGFLMVAGDQYSPSAYRNTPLRDILPIEIKGPEPEAPDLTQAYRPVLTPAGRFHPIFRFSPDEAENGEIWNRLAELFWESRSYRAKRGAEVLAVHPGQAEEGDNRHPLVVQEFVGAGRSMFFGFDETWRWRFREDEVHFNQFWIQTVRYLARNRLGRVELRLDRQTPYRRGEPIRVTVRFPDDAPPPPLETRVLVVAERTTRRPGGEIEKEAQTLSLEKVEGSRATYETLLTRTPEGDYRFWLSAPPVPPSAGFGKPETQGRVLAPPGEMDRLRMNRQEMEQAAAETQGRFYDLTTAEDFLKDLPAGTRVALSSSQPPQLLWNRPLVFGLALLLLTTEWFMRKRKHLL